jgi:hypothetical protein
MQNGGLTSNFRTAPFRIPNDSEGPEFRCLLPVLPVQTARQFARETSQTADERLGSDSPRQFVSS